MEDIPFVVQVSLSAVLVQYAIPIWWNQKMWWFGWEADYTPAEMWELDPMAVINRIESYLSPHVFT